MTLLRADNLQLEFPRRGGALRALRGVSFSLAAGERLGIVGESGAGKSLAAAALLNLVAEPGKVCGGEVWFDNRDLLKLSPDEIRQVRGRKIAMIFQDPMTALNPVLTVGRQLTECLEAHGLASGKKAEEIAEARLREASIPSPRERLAAYPHELSGGMRQRAAIAAALIAEPEIIIADEPTTALDVTIQADMMALLARLCARRGMALILITHDLSLVSQMTDNILVMYAGLIVERGATADVIARPRHPYTRGLLASLTERGGGRFYQIPGNMPPLTAIPSGCAFHPRCQYAKEVCEKNIPPLSDNSNSAACHFADEIASEEMKAESAESKSESDLESKLRSKAESDSNFKEAR